MRIRLANWLSLAAVAAVGIAHTLFGWFLATVIYFRHGAYFMDAGIFSYSLASKMAPMNSPRLAPYLGANFQSVHVFFSPLGFLKLTGLFVTIPGANFSLFMAVQQGVAAIFGGFLLWFIADIAGARGWMRIVASSIGAAALPFSNMVFGSMLYPHPEPFGAAIAGIGLLLVFGLPGKLQSRTYKWLAWAVLAVGLLGREDMGLHVAITLAAVWILAPKTMWAFTAGKPLLRWLAPGALLVTLASTYYQSAIDPSHKSRFSDVFSGTPPYAHLLDMVALHHRFGAFWHQRGDLIAVFGALTVIGAIFRNRLLLAYPLASAFWLLLNFTAVDPAKAVLGTYNQFALTTYLAAPAILLVVTGGSLMTKARSRALLLPVATATVLALGIGGILPSPVGGGFVFDWLGRNKAVSYSQMQLDEARLTALVRSTPRLVVDDGVFSIDPVLTRFNKMAEDKHGANGVNAVVFMPGYSIGWSNIERLLRSALDGGRRVRVDCLAPAIVVAKFEQAGASGGYKNLGAIEAAIGRCN